MAIRIQLRKDHPNVWDSADPTLAAGEFGFAWDSADSASFGRLKIGDGSTSWTNLPYFYSAGDSAGNYASSGNTFSISPSFDGKTTWNPEVDGTLNIGAGASALPSYEYTIVPSFDMTATVKMWGAGGAQGYTYTNNPPSSNGNTDGGGGGYTTATMIFRANTTYVLRIGEGGIVDVITSVSGGATYLAGGIGHTGSVGGTQGGGYSGIFEGSATFANARLIAGGGGGGGDSIFTQAGGAGGGSTGQSGGGSGDGLQSGGGGTQAAGGSASPYNNATAGSQLTGGLSQNTTTVAGLGGGGGGYYGGGGGNVGGGGGGSGFVSSNADISNGSTSQGNYGTPANNSDTSRSNAGEGGTTGQTYGSDGRIILEFV